MMGTAASFSSCSDFMDIVPTNEYSSESIFADAGLTQAAVNEIYNYVSHGAEETSLTGLTDDAYYTHDEGQVAINQASISGSYLGWFSYGRECPFSWSRHYKGIRYANNVIENIDNVPAKEGYDVKAMKGEAYFLRAYLYTEMMRGHGGVPLILEAMDWNETEKMTVPRSNIDEIVAQIVKDCEVAEECLPETVAESETGRATRYAATALKARVQLQAASPLYADRTVNTLACNQFNGDRAATYRAAREAAKEVINSGVFELLDCSAGTVAERADKWHQIIITNNKEQIWVRQFGTLTYRTQNWLCRQHGPNGYHGYAGITPTHNFAMAFENEDGSLPQGLAKVGDHQTTNPYTGREPRFYATIGADGSEWGRVRPEDTKMLDPTPMGNLQCGYYEVTDGDSDIELTLPNDEKLTFKGQNGIDTRHGPIEDWNGSWTGYYERKLIDQTIDCEKYPQMVPYTFIRLAEMYLIAAEASVELGELDEAAKYLDALRGRVGNVSTKTALAARGQAFNQEDMREFVRHERRIELAYEDSRFYDVRRWMIAPETNSQELTGIMIFARLKDGKTAYKPYIHDEDTWEYNYYVQSLKHREDRKWDNKMYFAPIPRDEINRSNGNLIQNPGME